VLLLIYLPRKDERPSWLTCSGQITHIVVTRRLQAECRTGSVRRPKTGVLPTVLRNQLMKIEKKEITENICSNDADTIVLVAGIIKIRAGND